MGELGNCGRDLKTLVEDDLLALEADVLGPLDKSGEICGGLNVLADAEVARARLEERVLDGLGGLGASGGRSTRGGLGGLGLGLQSHNHIDANIIDSEDSRVGSLRRGVRDRMIPKDDSFSTRSWLSLEIQRPRQRLGALHATLPPPLEGRQRAPKNKSRDVIAAAR